MPSAASRIDGGTAFSAARVAMMMVGSVSSASTRPPTSGAERGRPKKLMNTARPSRPKTIDGTAARLLMLTSMRSVSRFLRRELLEVDRRRDAERERQHQRDQQHEERADQRAPDAGELRARASRRW